MIIKDLFINAFNFVKEKVVSFIGLIGGASIGNILKVSAGVGLAVATVIQVVKSFRHRYDEMTDETKKDPVDKILDKNYKDYRKKKELKKSKKMKRVSLILFDDKPRKPVKADKKDDKKKKKGKKNGKYNKYKKFYKKAKKAKKEKQEFEWAKNVNDAMEGRYITTARKNRRRSDNLWSSSTSDKDVRTFMKFINKYEAEKKRRFNNRPWAQV